VSVDPGVYEKGHVPGAVGFRWHNESNEGGGSFMSDSLIASTHPHHQRHPRGRHQRRRDQAEPQVLDEAQAVVLPAPSATMIFATEPRMVRFSATVVVKARSTQPS
jgi:hypothetical protein